MIASTDAMCAPDPRPSPRRRIRRLAPRTGHCLLLLALAAWTVLPAARAELPDFTRLVEANAPSVVNISTVGKSLPPGIPGIESIPEDSPLYEFYRRFFERQGPPERESRSLGSGFIISGDGYIVTNFHVVKQAERIRVRLSDRREYEARLVGGDEPADVALLKIEAEDLPSVRIGRSRDLKVGEWVLAIGSPFGFDHTVTAGIVSAKGRSLPRENYVPFIQTDVAINPGNSGGPLFNLRGEVVGVNAQIFTRTGQFNGLSFAIPIDVAMDVVDQIRTHGKVTRGWLGIMIQDVTQELAESFGMDRPRGALVAKVLEGSPAEKAGLKPGDIVLSFNGEPLARSSDLPPLVGRARAGSRARLEVLREGTRRTMEVTLGELPAAPERLARGGEPRSEAERRLGIRVADLTEQQREELEIDEGGVVVSEVLPGPARKAGIRAGDVILMVNTKRVTGRKSFQELVEAVPPGKAVSVLVQRDGNPIFLALKPREE